MDNEAFESIVPLCRNATTDGHVRNDVGERFDRVACAIGFEEKNVGEDGNGVELTVQ